DPRIRGWAVRCAPTAGVVHLLRARPARTTLRGNPRDREASHVHRGRDPVGSAPGRTALGAEPAAVGTVGAGRRGARGGGAGGAVRRAGGGHGGERVERLILLGDVVDLSHGTFAHGVEELNSLLAQDRGVVEVSELVYVPGNHDRHWWTLQCEYDWLIRPLLEGEPGEARLDHPRTTPPEGRQDATLFRDALPDHADLMITVAYPDYAFDAGDARVHCHHGHLLRDVYALGAELLETVLEDMSDPERRNVDRQRHRTGWSRRTESEQPGDDAARAARVAAARELFADAIRITLGDGADGRTGRVGLEALEQLSAPLIDLD